MHCKVDSLPLSHQGSPALLIFNWKFDQLEQRSVELCVCVCVCVCIEGAICWGPEPYLSFASCRGPALAMQDLSGLPGTLLNPRLPHLSRLVGSLSSSACQLPALFPNWSSGASITIEESGPLVTASGVDWVSLHPAFARLISRSAGKSWGWERSPSLTRWVWGEGGQDGGSSWHPGCYCFSAKVSKIIYCTHARTDFPPNTHFPSTP